MQIILASQSPRRRELLSRFGLPFAVQATQADETMGPGKDPASEVARVSRLKARGAVRREEDLVIAADTIVVCDGRILGKPHSPEEAEEMLFLLSGRAHQVMTGVTLLRGDKEESFTEITQVYFRDLSQKEIADYVRSGEPMDKAGAYAIQGGAGLFVEKIEGDYFNVMGLPVCRLWQRLRIFAPECMEEGT